MPTRQNVFVINLALLMIFAINGCKKDTTADDLKDTPADDLIEIPLLLPPAIITGTPGSIPDDIPNFKPLTYEDRPPFLAPKGVKNLAFGKSVTSSEMEPIMGDLKMIVDGDKNATDTSVVELGPLKQWVQIDLEAEYDIYAVVLWHYHKKQRVYFDVVVQISNDKDFIADVTTIYNNDLDNSLGLGIGKDQHYADTAEGLLVDAGGTKGQYVRFYSNKNSTNEYSHYIEAEVYAK